MAWWRAIGSVASRKAVVVLVAVASLYFWWVTTQYGRINEFNQRQLSNAALVLKNTIENAVRNVRNYRYDEKEAAAGANQVCAFDDDQPYLTLDGCGVFKDYAGTFQSPEFSSELLAVVASRSDQTDRTIRFQLQIATVLGELSFIEPFEVAFVANGGGVVRYQESPTARRWASRLRWGERAFRDDTATHTAEPRLHDVSQLLGEETWNRASSVSSRTNVTLGGESAVLYLQPLAVESMANGAPLVLGAVVPARDLMWRALAMDTYFVALLVWLLLFALLGIPFIKLVSLHRHERITLRDVRHLYLSAAGLLTLWVFGALAVDQYLRWQATGDAGVKAFAEDLSAKFAGEVRDALHTLDRYDDIVLRHRQDFVGKAMLADWFNRSSEAPPAVRPAARAEYDEFTFGPSLYLERAQWIGPEGQQAWKITSDKTAKPVDVKTRPYFQAVNEGNLYQLKGAPYCFFIAPDRSIRDGKFYTFLSMRSRLSLAATPAPMKDLTPYDTCQEGQTGDAYVAVASLKLLSLLRPPLPVGYGFVVVNRDGRTMYHSDPQLSLRERFFTELGDEAAARALAFTGADGWLSTTYRERPHRLYFLPLPLARAIPSALPAEERDEVRGFSGLYLVVFRDVSIEQAVVARAFLIGLIGPLLAQLAVVGLALWAVGVVSKHRDGAWSHWLWPDGSREPLHKALTVATAVILVISVLLFEWTPVGGVIFLVLPLVAAAVSIGIYAFGGWRGRARSPLVRPRWYALKFALLFVCLVGVPAITLFSLTLGHQFGKLIDSEEHGLWAQIDDVILTVQSDARREQHPGWYGQRAAGARRDRLASWPAPFDVAVPHDESTTLSWVVELSSWLDRQLPVRSELTARQWYDDSRFSYNPPGTAGLPVGPVAWGGLLVACAALVFWIGWCARHLFFADLQTVPHPGEGTSAQAWAACTADERFALMQVADEHVANPRQRPIILSLISKGLLVLDPDLHPRDAELESYIRNEGRASTDLQAWEAAAGERSWHSVRLALFATMAVAAIFLLTTQPGLQSDLAGLASGIVSVGGMAVKIRDVAARWFEPRAGS